MPLKLKLCMYLYYINNFCFVPIFLLNFQVYNCRVCQNKNFKLEESYKIHLLKEHSTVPGSIPCKSCHVVCPDEETLLNHVMKAHKHPNIQCEHCSKQFTRQSHVLRHMAQKGCGKKMAKFPCEVSAFNE